MIHFVTSCGPNYSRPWLFPTLDKLAGKRVTALLVPSDSRLMPSNVERADYTGDRFYQDGLFLEFLRDVSPEDIVVLADADAVIQRDLTAEETSLLESLEDGFLVGHNRNSTQLGSDELLGLKLLHTLEATASRFGVSCSDLLNCPMYNWGLVAAKASTWKRLKDLYRSMRGDNDPQDYFESVVWMQYLLCVLLHTNKIPVIPMPLEMHSHEHYGLTYAHSITNRKLYYKEVEVFFAHYTRGVTHGGSLTRVAVKSLPHVVWHVANMGNWRVVVTEQLTLLRRVELTEVDCVYIGNLEELPWLFEEAANHEIKLNLVASDQSLALAESLAIAHIDALAKERKTDRPIIYFHTKGVSRPNDLKRMKWRRTLQEFVIKPWKENLAKLEGHDAIGFNWINCSDPHFSGNFWIASPEWIRKLPDFRVFYARESKRTRPLPFDAMPRFVCEYWIGAAPGIRVESLGVTDQPWERLDYDSLLEASEQAQPKYLTWITSSAETYDRQWVWNSLSNLSSPVMAYLDPKDGLVLPKKVERAAYHGDRWFYDGQLFCHDRNIADSEVIALFDVDAIFQRDVHGGELDPPCDGFTAGPNIHSGQLGKQEYSMLQPKFSMDVIASRIGLPPSIMMTAPIYNLGLVSGRASTWRYLRYLYVRHVCKQGPEFFGNFHYQQYLICLLLDHYKIPVRLLGYETHTHGHFPPLQREHSIKEGKLYYKDKLVLFIHNVKGVTH